LLDAATIATLSFIPSSMKGAPTAINKISKYQKGRATS
jgi:hypothetical protein